MPDPWGNLSSLRQRLRDLADPRVAEGALRFFKTGPGEYGEGDVFLGLRAAAMHPLAREYRSLPLPEVEQLLQSRVHEERQVALLILIRAFEDAGDARRKQLFDFCLAHTRHINNWDLVDCSAPAMVGGYLRGRSRKMSPPPGSIQDLWERRMAIVATLPFIRAGDFADTLAIVELLLDDEHDLIHKASGWMLREVGNRDPARLESFLEKHGRSMPRIMLRYAIERFPADKRKAYLARKG
jgi:3-methyladenine DNA glycosylase AlkD